MLRYTADLRTLFVLSLAVVVSVVQWHLPAVNPLLLGLSCWLSLTVAVISHNHNHLGIWKNQRANLLTSYVISLYYGYPAVGWIPTHNQVHHKLNNREGDSSRSPKFFKRNHLFALLVYPTLTGMEQSKEIWAYLKALKAKNKTAFWEAASQFIVFFGLMALLLVLDWKKALLYFLVPQQFALFMIQVFNFIQHVEADAESDWNHSRNFVSPILNALLFNNGYHTVHHQKPGVHWTQLPALHAQCAGNIHPELLVQSWWGYMIWTFLLRPFVPGARAPVLTAEARVDAA